MRPWMLIAAALGLAAAAPSWAQVGVNGYFRNDGSYVAPHWRSAPDNTPSNNYSYPGNTNPYTGQTAPLGGGSLYSPYGSGGTQPSPSYRSPYGSGTLGSPDQPLGSPDQPLGGGSRSRSCIGLLC